MKSNEAYPLNDRYFVLIEDDEDHAEIIKRSFAKSKVANRLEWFDNGPQGIAHLEQLSREGAPLPQALLLDLKLPRMNGHEILARLKGDPQLKHLPIVILTTSDRPSDREKAFDLGANGYHVKPLHLKTFYQMIDDFAHYWGLWNMTVYRPLVP